MKRCREPRPGSAPRGPRRATRTLGVLRDAGVLGGARVLGVLGSAGVFGVAMGCSNLGSAANPELPGWMHRPSWSMHVLYQRTLEVPSRDETEPYERGRPELDPRGRRVFVGSSDHGLYAARAEDGSPLWRFETLGAVQCEPLYDQATDRLYFGSNDGALYAVDASTGKLAWRFMTNAEVARRPVLEDGVLYVVNANDTVVAILAKTGAQLWAQHRAPAAGMEVAGYAGPLLWRGWVYTAFSDGHVTAFDAASGAERWQAVDLAAEAEDTLGEVPRYLDVDTTPVSGSVDGAPAIYVASYEGGVFALDATTGTPLWSHPAIRGTSELVMWRQPAHRGRKTGNHERARELLLVSTGTSGLWALDPETGIEQWHRALPHGGISAPVPILGALMVTTTQQGFYLLSPLDGSVIDGVDAIDGFSMPAAAHGARAFVLSNTGKLVSIHVAAPL